MKFLNYKNMLSFHSELLFEAGCFLSGSFFCRVEKISLTGQSDMFMLQRNIVAAQHTEPAL